MKKLKKVICAILIASFTTPALMAGENLYIRGDIQSGNLYTGVLGMGIAAWINHNANDYAVDSYLTINSIHNAGVSNGGRMVGFKVHDLFNDIGAGIKLGYQTDDNTLRFINWAVYGSFHYRESSFAILTRIDNPEYSDIEGFGKAYEYNNAIHKFQIGIGANITFGEPRAIIRPTVDFGLRYNIPFIYSGDLCNSAGGLNSGLSPVLSISVGSEEHWLKTVGIKLGIWVDFGTYKLFKRNDRFDSDPYKYTTVGMNFTLCPWK